MKALLFTVLAGLVVAGCGSGGSADVSLDLAGATAATTHAGTAKLAMRMSVSSSALSGRKLDFGGDGVMDLAHHRGEMHLDMSAIAEAAGQSGSDYHVTEVIDGLTVFMRTPFLDGKLPAGVKWLKLDLGKATQRLGIDLGSFMSGTGFDPSQYLTQLKAASGKVERKGTETIRGTPTTRYHAVVDYDKVPDTLPADQREAARKSVENLEKLSGIDEVPVDIWLDARHRVRRVDYAMTMKPTTGPQAGQEMHMDIAMDIYGFGTPVHVTVPPASETKDVTSLVGQAGSTTP